MSKTAAPERRTGADPTVAPHSALAVTAAELLRRHRPDGTTACPACGQPSPCPVALAAEEVCRAAAAVPA